MRCYNIPSMNQPIKRTRTLSQMTIIRIIGADPIEDQIETIRKIGDTGTEAVEVETVFDVGSFDFAEHFVAFEAAEPVFCCR